MEVMPFDYLTVASLILYIFFLTFQTPHRQSKAKEGMIRVQCRHYNMCVLA